MGKIYTRFLCFENHPTDIAIKAEELDEEDKGHTIFKSEVVKAIKEVRRKKATGDEKIPVALLKEIGDSRLKIMTALVNKIYMSRDLSKNFIDVTMIALLMKNQAKKCVDHRRISLISRTGNTVSRILSKSLESEIEKDIEEGRFGFRKGKATSDAIGLMRIISERVVSLECNRYGNSFGLLFSSFSFS